jgi:hypothetical protein
MADTSPSYPPVSGRDSALDTVKEQTSNIASSAGDAGGDVIQSAKEQGSEVVAETRRQARNLYHQARAQVSTQASGQQQRAADSLRRLGDELRTMADKSGASGPATELAREASDRVEGVADWLEARRPGDMLAEVRDYARRHPGAFLAGAAVLGVLAGRLTRGMMSGDDGARATTDRAYAPAPAVSTATPEPAITTTPMPVTDADPVVGTAPVSVVEAAGGEYRR